jgi:acyl carrier protein
VEIDVLNYVFQEVFDDNSLRISRETTANDVDGWDSMTYILLISAIEDKFGIEFSQKEVVRFKTVGDLMDSINLKLV